MLALTDPDREEAADDVVDALVRRRVRVPAAVEDEERVVGGLARPLVQQPGQRRAAVALRALQPDETRQHPGRVAAPRRRASGRRRSPRPPWTWRRRTSALATSRPVSMRLVPGAVALDVGLEQLAHRRAAARRCPSRQLIQRGDGRPGVRDAPVPTTRPKWPPGTVRLVGVRLRGRSADRAHRRRRRDRVRGAVEGQHRARDVRERRHRLPDEEAAGEHPVVRDELLDELRDRGPG